MERRVWAAIPDGSVGTPNKLSPSSHLQCSKSGILSLLVEKARHFPTLIRGMGDTSSSLSVPASFVWDCGLDTSVTTVYVFLHIWLFGHFLSKSNVLLRENAGSANIELDWIANRNEDWLTFCFKVLKLSIMTPTNRFSTKNEPTTMKATKKQYATKLFSYSGCISTYERYKMCQLSLLWLVRSTPEDEAKITW